MTIYQVTHKMLWLNQECRNIYYYDTVIGNPTTTEWQDIVDEIRADFIAEVIGRLSTDWKFYSIDYRIVDTVGLLGFESIPTLGDLPGTGVGDDTVTQVAMLLSYKGTTTKPNRARTYMCGLTEGQLQDSLWSSAARTAFEAFGDLQSVLNAAGTNDLQRVSAQWNSSHTQVIAFNNIAGSPAVASQVPATQRRRRIGVGI